MHYNNPSTQALYRKLREEGSTVYEAAQTIQLLLGDVPKPCTNVIKGTSWGYWKNLYSSNKHELPYYHGKKRRF